ncbi:MAG TPA: cytochrome c [Candidatus Binataceae bacterium]|nr:cytochrome c [Candidatus Binataceae bacterium]
MKRSPFGLLVFLACAVLLTSASRGAVAQATSAAPKADKPAAAAPAGNVQNGMKLFAADGCYECHGRAAQGGVGPRLGPHPLPLAAIITYIRQPTAEMPPYTAKVISDAEIADIYAFLQSIPDPPKPDTIPLLK